MDSVKDPVSNDVLEHDIETDVSLQRRLAASLDPENCNLPFAMYPILQQTPEAEALDSQIARLLSQQKLNQPCHFCDSILHQLLHSSSYTRGVNHTR